MADDIHRGDIRISGNNIDGQFNNQVNVRRRIDSAKCSAVKWITKKFMRLLCVADGASTICGSSEQPAKNSAANTIAILFIYAIPFLRPRSDRPTQTMDPMGNNHGHASSGLSNDVPNNGLNISGSLISNTRIMLATTLLPIPATW